MPKRIKKQTAQDVLARYNLLAQEGKSEERALVILAADRGVQEETILRYIRLAKADTR